MTTPVADDAILSDLDWEVLCQCGCHEILGTPTPPAAARLRFIFSDQEVLVCIPCAERAANSPLLVVKPL